MLYASGSIGLNPQVRTVPLPRQRLWAAFDSLVSVLRR